MYRLFARWRALGAGERHLLLGLMAALPAVAALLRVLGVVRTVRLLERTSANAPPRRADAAEVKAAQRLAQLAALAGRRGVMTATCLRQALLVYWQLRRRGLSPELKLGFRKVADAFDAHAWVELQGVALGLGEIAHVPLQGDLLRPPSAASPCPDRETE